MFLSAFVRLELISGSFDLFYLVKHKKSSEKIGKNNFDKNYHKRGVSYHASTISSSVGSSWTSGSVSSSSDGTSVAVLSTDISSGGS